MFLRQFSFQRIPLLAPDGVSGGDSSSGAGSGAGTNSPTPSGTTSSPSPSAAPSSTPSSAPSASPSSAPTSPSASPPAGSPTPGPSGADFNFSSIFEEPVQVQTEPTAPTQVVPQAPVQPPAAAPEQVAQPVQPQVATPVTGQQETQVQQQPTSRPQFDPADPVSLARGLVEHQAAAIEHLAQTQFGLSPQELEALESDPGGAIPRLLARTAVFMQQQFLTQLSRVVPMQIQRHGEVLQRHASNEDKFFAAWPQLDRAKHGTVIKELGQRYRQLNPDASLDQMIKDLGPFVLHRVGLPFAAPGVAAPAAQAARPASNGAAPQPQAFTPASPGVAVHTQQIEDAGYGFLGQHGD